MRSKAPLVLMEQMVMLLVFALAAALCLQAFVKSDSLSRRSEARDRALAAAQDAAEAVRHTGGDFEQAAAILEAALWDEDSLAVFYGSDWELSEPVSERVYPFGYTLGACRAETGVPGLGKAEIWVQDDESGEELIRLEAAWQEGTFVEVDDGTA